jgi:hypothetical protein
MAWSHRTDGRAEDFTQWGRGSGLPWGQGSGLGSGLPCLRVGTARSPSDSRQICWARRCCLSWAVWAGRSPISANLRPSWHNMVGCQPERLQHAETFSAENALQLAPMGRSPAPLSCLGRPEPYFTGPLLGRSSPTLRECRFAIFWYDCRDVESFVESS